MSIIRATPLSALLLLLSLAQPLRAQTPAEAVVQKAIDDVVMVLDEQAAALAEDTDRAYALAEEFIAPYFDFDRMSYYILGNHWKNAPDSQKTGFRGEFKRLLVNTYAAALCGYTSEEEVTFKETITSPKDPDIVIVPTEVKQKGGKPVTVAYRMHRKNDQWRIYDVAIDGISLVKNYRADFAGQIRKGGFDGLVAGLTEHNRDAKAKKCE